MRFLIGLVFVGFSFNASAIDTDRCPRRVRLDIKIEKVYQSSIYKSEAGWKNAKKALDSISGLMNTYSLKNERVGSCYYQTADGDSAILSTAEFQDPEDNEPNLVDQLVTRFQIDGADFVTFLPVAEYSRTELVLRNAAESIRVKARFIYSKTGKPINVSMGMISVIVL